MEIVLRKVIAYLTSLSEPYLPSILTQFQGRVRVSKAGAEKMDDADKGLLQSILPPLAILALTTIIFLRFNSSGVILAGSLGVAFFVVGDIIWSLRSSRPPTR